MKWGCKKVDYQLLDYITRETAAGLDRETMRAHLVEKGWKESAIEEGFIALDAEVVVPNSYIFKRKLIAFLFVISVLFVLPVSLLIVFSEPSSGGGGRNASIKQTISNIRSQAELVYIENGYTYESVCTNQMMVDLINAATDVAHATPYDSTEHSGRDAVAGNGEEEGQRFAVCQANAISYAVASPLIMFSEYFPPAQFWCVDSTGYSGYALGVRVLRSNKWDNRPIEEYRCAGLQ